jgi:alanine racemase
VTADLALIGAGTPPQRWVEVDLNAIRFNVRALLRRLPPTCRLIAVVKADAYGCGAFPVARAALSAGAWGLAVSTPDEAMALRELCEPDRLLVMGGLAPARCASAAATGSAVMCYSDAMVDALESGVPAGRRLAVHLKVDTGMGRLGCAPEEAPGLARRIARSSKLHLAGTMTHFAAAGSDPDYTQEQFERFAAAIECFDVSPGIRHAASSEALLRHPEMALDAVRPGLALYGGLGEGLRPALALRAIVTQVKDVPRGQTIGYERAWTAKRASRIATVAIGYEDGVMWGRGNRGQVVIHGRRVPLVGRVSMDAITIDVGEVPEAAAGDEVTVIGDGITLTEVAGWSGTIAHEVMTALGSRVARRYLDGDAGEE